MQASHVTVIAQAACVALVWLVCASPVTANVGAALIFEGETPHASIIPRLRHIDPARLDRVLALIGAGGRSDIPTRVIVADEQSRWARQVSSWASGYAIPPRNLIVIFPERVVSYPHESLDDVLIHEFAHIVLHRATSGRPLPRWFHEGVAMAAERSSSLEDHARVMWAMVSGTPVPLPDLEEQFVRSSASVTQAYVLSRALVRYLLSEFGKPWLSRFCAVLSTGMPFEQAFARTTGRALADVEAAFWARHTLWMRWVPVATSSAVIWGGILALAMYVFKKQRRRAEAIRNRWEDEDSPDRS